jgi:hypothetical protein
MSTARRFRTRAAWRSSSRKSARSRGRKRLADNPLDGTERAGVLSASRPAGTTSASTRTATAADRLRSRSQWSPRSEQHHRRLGTTAEWVQPLRVRPPLDEGHRGDGQPGFFQHLNPARCTRTTPPAIRRSRSPARQGVVQLRRLRPQHERSGPFAIPSTPALKERRMPTSAQARPSTSSRRRTTGTRSSTRSSWPPIRVQVTRRRTSRSPSSSPTRSAHREQPWRVPLVGDLLPEMTTKWSTLRTSAGRARRRVLGTSSTRRTTARVQLQPGLDAARVRTATCTSSEQHEYGNRGLNPARGGHPPRRHDGSRGEGRRRRLAPPGSL